MNFTPSLAPNGSMREFPNISRGTINPIAGQPSIFSSTFPHPLDHPLGQASIFSSMLPHPLDHPLGQPSILSSTFPHPLENNIRWPSIYLLESSHFRIR